MDHFEAQRRNPQIYEEVSNTSRSFDADTEASFVDGIPQRQSIVSNSDEKDLFEEGLVEKKAFLSKWQRKLRHCSCCLKAIALVSMMCAGYHLLNPPTLH